MTYDQRYQAIYDMQKRILSELQGIRTELEAGSVIGVHPGWAEAVATPDEDAGFVFTPVPGKLTGLLVNISVGDDTPLVIACPQDLDFETVAAIRHWVVRHADALTDHWRNVIDSSQLIERIKSNGSYPHQASSSRQDSALDR